jgi:transcriptional regulator with XRE-family HTH domain
MLLRMNELPEFSDLKDRLKHARKKIRDATQAVAAEAIGVTSAAISNWERGEDEPTRENLVEAATFYGVPYAWLAKGEADTPNVRKVPLIGFVGAGDHARYFNFDEGYHDEVDAPANAGPKTVAVEVRGESMRGFADNRWLLYYDDVRDPPTDDLFGRLCVVGLPDDRVVVKKLMKGSRRGFYHLLSSNADPMLDQPVSWAARVIWIQPR